MEAKSYESTWKLSSQQKAGLLNARNSHPAPRKVFAQQGQKQHKSHVDL